MIHNIMMTALNCQRSCTIRLDEENNMYKAPAIVFSLKQVGNLFITECIKKPWFQRKRKCWEFFKNSLNKVVNKVLEETQSQKKQQTKKLYCQVNVI